VGVIEYATVEKKVKRLTYDYMTEAASKRG
jgi:hypothetical protein